MLQLHHGLCVVLGERQAGRHRAHIDDGECDGATSSDKVHCQDGDVKVVPATAKQVLKSSRHPDALVNGCTGTTWQVLAE
jgi:hypothetical protein